MHSQVLSRALVAALAGSCSLGCGAERPTFGREDQAIVDGTATGTAHAPTLYVMAEVRDLSGTKVFKVGSGALVAPNLLVTALHVVSTNPTNVPFACDANGEGKGGTRGALGPTLAPEKVAVFEGPVPFDEPLARGRRIISSGSATICQNDLAFVVLDTPLTLASYQIHRGAPVAAGAELTVVGYGNGLDMPDAFVERTSRLVDVTAVGQWIRTFTVSSGPCEGDSGGPALSASGELVGVFSSVAADCRSASASPKYTDISYFEPLVEQAFDAAEAGSPWPVEPTGGAGGEASDPAGAAGTGPTEELHEAAESDAGCSFCAPRTTSHAGVWAMIVYAGLYLRARRRSA